MSIEQTSVVDFVSINKEGEVMLTISDHLEWDEKNEHVVLDKAGQVVTAWTNNQFGSTIKDVLSKIE
ncbi:hypothetical protein A2753_02785 [Candidatus Uhrbacteria bacterium RIFCSPHIGHO2_01_FULL_47_11]|nr:MAG: hypothetical protein A2753_02785 [Candidatus Uhrbacteria bacterium RIFCSPHIGHO2_01_FULL_47_11]